MDVKGHVDRSRRGRRAWPRPWWIWHGGGGDLVHVSYEVEVEILFMWGLLAMEEGGKVGWCDGERGGC